MARSGESMLPEVESFNLAELNVSGLDMRLELTTIVPQTPICTTNCPHNCATNCGCNYNVCNCHSLNCGVYTT